jgi:hypothetical protein
MDSMETGHGLQIFYPVTSLTQSAAVGGRSSCVPEFPIDGLDVMARSTASACCDAVLAAMLGVRT